MLSVTWALFETATSPTPTTTRWAKIEAIEGAPAIVTQAGLLQRKSAAGQGAGYGKIIVSAGVLRHTIFSAA